MFDKEKNIYIKQDENSSSFVIDLKKKIVDENESLLKKRRLFDFFDKIFERGLKNALSDLRFFVARKFGYFTSLFLVKIKKIPLFSFFSFVASLSSILGRSVYKIIYKIGWLLVFFIRFIYLLLFALLKRIVDKTLDVFDRNQSFLHQTEEGKLENDNDQEFLLFRTDKFKSIVLFLVALIIIVLPFKIFAYYKNLDNVRGKVLGASEEAVSSFLNASESVSNMDFKMARSNFNFAAENFSEAKEELSEINNLIISLSALYPDERIRMVSNGKSILAAGQLASELGEELSKIFDDFTDKRNDNVGFILNSIVENGEEMIKTADRLEGEINKININDLPEDYKEKFSALKSKSSFLSGSIKEFVELTRGLKILLGMEYDKRYLLVFQNNAELRATGGFIGSFALIDFKEGKIKNIEVPGGGSYDTEGGMKVLVASPEPLHLVNPLWHFWDANWWPDWPTSAEKLMWFYEKSDGPTVDGVVSLTPSVLEKILEITGPIDMTDQYGVILDKDNFWITVQDFAEQKQDVTLKPKKIIGDLAVKLMDELPKRLNKDVLLKLVGAMNSGLNEKQILFYFKDENLQRNINNYGWGGRQEKTSRDYLSVINTNIAGGKSDRKMEETIKHEAKILQNGSVIDTIEIKRAHTGIKNEKFTGVRNVNWMRIYVPLGSELLEASGFIRPDDIFFEDPDPSWAEDPMIKNEKRTLKIDKDSGTEIYEDNGYTVFANWSMVDPGKSVVIRLKYRLPFKLEYENKKSSNGLKFWENDQMLSYYSLLVQKQPGANPSSFVSNLSIPSDIKIDWSYPENMAAVNQNGWGLSCSLDSDKYWAVILEKKN